MKRAKTTSKPKNEWFFVDRLYRWLPVFLLLFSFSNVYFVVKYVNTERQDFSEIRDQALLNASNVYEYVSFSLSNEIVSVRQALSNEVQRVRFSNEMRSRLNALPFTNIVNSVSHELNDVINSSSVLPSVPVYGRFFRVGGRPCLDIDGSYFCVGSDFGYGRIDSIFPVGVVCDGTFHPLQKKPSRLEIVKNGIP